MKYEPINTYDAAKKICQGDTVVTYIGGNRRVGVVDRVETGHCQSGRRFFTNIYNGITGGGLDSTWFFAIDDDPAKP